MRGMKTVAVIGAGASGIIASKVLLQDGFDVTLFERQKELGGVWSEEASYVDLHTQQPGATMEFSDLYDGEEFSPRQHVHDYLKRYADRFGVTERIRFGMRVISIQKEDLKNSNLKWQIEVENEKKRRETCQFDFVVIASGVYSEVYMPSFKGQTKFTGEIVHACSIKNYDQFRNKRVAVIGGGKGSTDMAVLAATYARSCHLIFRRAYWLLPRSILGGRLPIGMLFSRVMAFPQDLFPDAPYNQLTKFFHRQFPGLFEKIFDSMVADIIATHGSDLYEDKIFIPDHHLKNAGSTSLIAKDFISLKKKGLIVGKLDTIDEIINENTIRLTSGEELQVDMIVCATGYMERCPFLSQQTAEALGLRTIKGTDKTEFNLYRRLIPVGVPNIAFVGFTISPGNWMVTEVASHWTSDYFLGRLKLPESEDRLREEIITHRSFIRQKFDRQINQVVPYWLAPIEIYLKDMGVSLYRTNNWISEYFTIYRPSRFKGLHEERRAIAQGRPIRRFYFSFTHTIFLLLLLFFFFFWLIFIR